MSVIPHVKDPKVPIIELRGNMQKKESIPESTL
jgi:hypothetical protein